VNAVPSSKGGRAVLCLHMVAHLHHKSGHVEGGGTLVFLLGLFLPLGKRLQRGPSWRVKLFFFSSRTGLNPCWLIIFHLCVHWGINLVLPFSVVNLGETTELWGLFASAASSGMMDAGPLWEDKGLKGLGFRFPGEGCNALSGNIIPHISRAVIEGH